MKKYLKRIYTLPFAILEKLDGIQYQLLGQEKVGRWSVEDPFMVISSNGQIM